MHHSMHMWMSGLLAGTAMLWSHASFAAPASPQAPGSCPAKAKEARQLLDAGQLRRAREAYGQCAATRCGSAASQQCRSALAQLDADIPSVVFAVTDGSGAQRLDVRVSMDGELLTSQLDGRSVEVDPGLHEFSFSTDQGAVHSEKVLILQGQRNRMLAVQLTPQASAPPSASPAPDPAAEKAAATEADVKDALPLAPKPQRGSEAPAASVDRPRGSPVLAYVVGGAGLAAVGSAFLLAHWGREDNLLLDRCAPNCKQESVDHVSHMYLAADITLGAGIVALGAATWLYLSRPELEDDRATQGYRVDVHPTASGAYATVGGAF